MTNLPACLRRQAPAGKQLKIFLHFLGPIIFVYILTKIDYQLFFEKIQAVGWFFIIPVATLMILEIVARAWKWRTILSSLGVKVSRITSVSIYWLGSFVGIITPGRLGELIEVYFLKERGASVFRSFFSVLVDRIIDFFVLLFLGALISVFFLKEVGIYIIFLAAFFILGIVLVALALNERSWLHRFFLRIFRKIFSLDLRQYSRFSLRRLWDGIRALKIKQIMEFFLYLILGWLFYFLARYLIALAIGLDLTFLEVSLISILVSIVTFLPISIAGLGTREATVIYLFSLFGFSKEAALLFSLLIFSVDILIIGLGLIPYLRESSLINKIKKTQGL